MRRHIINDFLLAIILGPFVKTILAVMDVTVKKFAMIRVEHDLTRVEHAHFGTTRYTTLSLSVIHVPGKPIPAPFTQFSLFSLATLESCLKKGDIK